MTEPLPLWDPHFHIFDVSDGAPSHHDPSELFAPDGDPVYGPDRYQAAIAAAGSGFVHVGGTWLEAISVCHLHKSGPQLAADCLAEARWAARELNGRDKPYLLVPSAPLEDPALADTLDALGELPDVRGVRQIVNFEPSWPRNARLGNLLDDPQWQQGFARLAEYGLSFDLQLNPQQYLQAAALIHAVGAVPVIVDHLGTPTLADLREQAPRYWQGIEALAACPQVTIKISMLHYIDPAWDQQPDVIDAIHRVIDTFGVTRCCFASNFPVDSEQGWDGARLYRAFKTLADQRYSVEQQRWLFADSARRAYRVEP